MFSKYSKFSFIFMSSIFIKCRLGIVLRQDSLMESLSEVIFFVSLSIFKLYESEGRVGLLNGLKFIFRLMNNLFEPGLGPDTKSKIHEIITFSN